MLFTPTDVDGCLLIDPEPREDDRGSFARAFCRVELSEAGVYFRVEQANLATTRYAGTVRGLHYQLRPCAETKLVRATRGALFDVVVDVRPGSPSYGRWVGEELTAVGGRALLVPAGCAHGYQTLIDDTDAFYLTDAAYDGSRERGVHHSDPALAIAWPLPPVHVSEKDRGLPPLAEAELP